MRTLRLTLLLCLFVLASSTTALAQKKKFNYNKTVAALKNQQGNSASIKKMLDKATIIRYYSSNGSVAPEWQYNYTIHVKSDEVTLEYTYSDQATDFIDEPITAAQYKKFKNKLVSQGIAKKEAEENLVGLCGAGCEDFYILDGQEELLHINCAYGELKISKGEIIDAFWELLSNEQRKMINKLENL